MIRIEIAVNNTVQIAVTDDSGTYAPEESVELSSLITSLVDYVTTHKPASAMDIALTHIMQTADDETLLSMQDIFPPWQIDRQYGKDTVLRFNGDLWRVLQAHRSQADWIPPDAVSLYTRINPPGTVGPWRQPQGAHDAYKLGDKAYHPTPDKVWEVDQTDAGGNNVWEPGVFGWKLVEGGS